ncbi:hypothetical protein A0H81_02480 [Grifola frondosa]|uniref:Uncharacterized protein n=1 Tax=Grifola frondosa TaxID=5627 RepID=A0A1C7MNG7_GRIFR|nr:hypothetical protein A0H81_02480 [Grifola frondosa]
MVQSISRQCHDYLHIISLDSELAQCSVMAIVNLANTLTFYFLQPLLRGVLSTFASSVSVTMMSRVMLNLHESVAGSDVIDTSTTLTASEDFTSLMFTSRITTHPDAPDALRFRESVYLSAAPEDPLTGEGHIEEVYELQELHPPHVHPKV